MNKFSEREKLLLKELKELILKFDIQLEDDYDWVYDGEDEVRTYMGVYLRGKDILLKINDDLFKEIMPS